MSIIVPSNHTRIGAWVNSKMSRRICIVPLRISPGREIRGQKLDLKSVRILVWHNRFFVSKYIETFRYRKRKSLGVDRKI